MQRKRVTLDAGAVLWEEGDVARNIAVVEEGKLGARTAAGGIVGVLFPGMVLGESALFAAEGTDERRTATVFAIDETVVTEYPAGAVRETLESGEDRLSRPVLLTLIGQTCRNLLITLAYRAGHPLLEDPLRGVVAGIARNAATELHIRSWDRFAFTARFLYDLRDHSDRVLREVGPHASERAEMVERASGLLHEMLEGQDALPLVEDFLRAERERSEWWYRGR